MRRPKRIYRIGGSAESAPTLCEFVLIDIKTIAGLCGRANKARLGFVNERVQQ